MKKIILWILFFVFLILIISPVDVMPGPVDDIVYGVLDLIIVGLLGMVRDKKKKALPPSEESESAGVNDER
jgi:bacteriorhodopsin